MVSFWSRVFFGFRFKPEGLFWILIYVSIRTSASLEKSGHLPGSPGVNSNRGNDGILTNNAVYHSGKNNNLKRFLHLLLSLFSRFLRLVLFLLPLAKSLLQY